MLLGEAQLKMIGATLYHIDRGGDITYHGPGQLVCYPILNLEDYHLGLKEYIHVLEEAVIRVCAILSGIETGRVKGATRSMDGRGNSAGTENLCNRSEKQSFCDNAWIGAECKYGFALFQLYPSLRIHG